MGWVYLGIAIAAEVLGTSLLKATHGFTRLWPSVGCIAGYVIGFVGLAFAVRTLPIGLAYAVWAGLGTVAIVTIGVIAFGEGISVLKVAGVALVIAGVGLLNLGGAH